MTQQRVPTRAPAEHARRSRKGRGLRRVLVSLIVVIGLLVGADFATAAYAEYKISKMLRAQLGVDDDPQVSVHGFPFITQALSGDYSDITVDASGVPVKKTLRDLEFHADLLHVRVPIERLMNSDVHQVPVDRLDGTVRISASDIGRMLKLPDLQLLPMPVSAVQSPTLTPAEPKPGVDETKGGTIAGFQLDASTSIVGQRTTISVYGLISLVKGQIQATPKKLKLTNSLISGSLPEPLQSDLLKRFVFKVDPGQLPFHVTPTAVGVEQGALSVTGTAKHIVIGKAPTA